MDITDEFAKPGKRFGVGLGRAGLGFHGHL
jgi:hypothetical protein